MSYSSDFGERWAQGKEDDRLFNELIRLPASVQVATARPETILFLQEVGLPEFAVPGFSSNLSTKEGLQHIYDIWGYIDEYSDEDKDRLNRYRVIGSEDNGGNSICIDTEEGDKIVILEHEDFFRTITFMNSSVEQLAEFLLLMRDVIANVDKEFPQAVKEYPVSADIRGEIQRRYVDELVEKLKAIDGPAMEDGGFWVSQLEGLW